MNAIYSFRLRFKTTKGFTTDDSKLLVFHNGREDYLAATPAPTTLKEAKWLEVRSTGYATKEDATLAADKLRRHLLLAGTIRWMGFDLGLDRATTLLGEEFRAQLEAQRGYRIRDSIHGADVYEEEECRETKFVDMSLQGSVTADPSVFINTMKAVEQKIADLSNAQIVSMSLLNDSLSVSSSDSQLLARVTAMEVLCERKRRSALLVQALEQFSKASDELALDNEERELLKSFLLNGKKESIGEACRRHVGTLLGEQKIETFDRIYKARSHLVHAGKGRGTTAEVADEALKFATELIKADIGLPASLE